MYDRKLYESIMNTVAPIVYKEINEAYDNMLLEKFEMKGFLDKVMEVSRMMMGKAKEADLDEKTRKAYRICRKFIVKVIDKIDESKGQKAVMDFIDQLKRDFTEDLKNHDLTPKQMFKEAKMIAIGLIGMASVATIYTEMNTELGYAPNTDPSKEIAASDTISSHVEEVRDTIRPYEYFRDTKRMMRPSQRCIDTLKKEEALSLVPYYVITKDVNEWKQGKLTIGYGHVICYNFRDTANNWVFPNTIPAKRQKEIKNAIMRGLKQGKIKESLCGTVNGELVNINTHMDDVITREEAELFLKYDFVHNTDNRIRVALQLKDDMDVDEKIDKNVAAYCYYDQNIYDAMTCCIYNMGYLKGKYDFVKRLKRCRFDAATNRINAEDFAYTFEAFKTIGKSERAKQRRHREYHAFDLGNLKKTLKDFNDFAD